MRKKARGEMSMCRWTSRLGTGLENVKFVLNIVANDPNQFTALI